MVLSKRERSEQVHETFRDNNWQVDEKKQKDYPTLLGRSKIAIIGTDLVQLDWELLFSFAHVTFVLVYRVDLICQRCSTC